MHLNGKCNQAIVVGVCVYKNKYCYILAILTSHTEYYYYRHRKGCVLLNKRMLRFKNLSEANALKPLMDISSKNHDVDI